MGINLSFAAEPDGSKRNGKFEINRAAGAALSVVRTEKNTSGRTTGSFIGTSISEGLLPAG